ncbi:MAG: hypothetical protein ACFB12_07520 [Leptolyngbyaceae cyanobacterium]
MRLSIPHFEDDSSSVADKGGDEGDRLSAIQPIKKGLAVND